MFYEIKIKFNQSPPPPPPKLLIHPKTAATFWFISVAKGAAKVICARRSNSSRLNSSFFFFLWQGTGEEERQRPHTGEKPVGFTAGHPAAANTQHTQLQRRDVTRETFFPRRSVRRDRSRTLRRIDRARRMKHFTIRSFISPSHFSVEINGH